MQLKNKQDNETYMVSTESDAHGGFMIFAKKSTSYSDTSSFCMHYRSLAEFNDEWEDA